jgi:hypothetical protein
VFKQENTMRTEQINMELRPVEGILGIPDKDVIGSI